MRNSRLTAWSALLLAALIASICVPCLAFAFAPPFTSIQGILTDVNGTPLPDGSYNVTLRLYDQDMGGNLLFTEYKPIATEDGLFTTELGAAAYADDLVFANPSNWLEVQVDGYPAMSPRIRLTSAPYARSTSQWHTIPGGVNSLGRVGIYAPAPQTPLHVAGDGELVRLQGNNGATSMTYLSFWENSGTFTGWIGDGSPTDLDMYLVSNAGDVNLNTQAGTVLTATAAGNVGIGTTTPYAPLHVFGDGGAVRLQKSGIGAASATYVSFNDAESANLGWVGDAGLDMYLASSAGDVNLYTPAGTVLTASDGGNVGIGTSTPQAKLHVFGNGEAVILQSSVSGPAASTHLSFAQYSGATIGSVGDGSDSDLDMYLISNVADVNLYTQAGTVLTASALGNVGIGETEPNEKFQVGGIPQGNISLTGNLTGYGGNSHPTLKTNGDNLFFDANSVYTGYIGYNSGFMDVSDKSMKGDIRQIDGALDKVSQINGVKFK